MARRKTNQEQLEDLEKRKGQIEARIQKKRAALRVIERKRDTRRKIIAGAVALEHADIDPAFAKTLRRLLNQHVKTPDDRNLFGLDG